MGPGALSAGDAAGRPSTPVGPTAVDVLFIPNIFFYFFKTAHVGNLLTGLGSREEH